MEMLWILNLRAHVELILKMIIILFHFNRKSSPQARESVVNLFTFILISEFLNFRHNSIINL